MTQFKIGDEVIMTADSGKGETFIHSDIGKLNGEYKATVIDPVFFPSEKNKQVCVKLEECPEMEWYFNLDGSCSTHPGMSIRPAKEEPTPSRWIEGRPISDGHYWIEKKNGLIEALTTYVGDTLEYEGIIRHSRISELPPPPPLKEIEAFGALEAIKKIKNDADFVKNIDKTIRFYSQPATAENLNKYFKTDEVSWHDKVKSLDHYIYKYNERNTIKLLFTPAALDMLEIK